jgi:prevent-host-death family protein
MYMTTLPVNEARQNFSALVDDAVRTHQRIHVTRNGKPAIVMLTEEDYESLVETVEILSDPETMRALETAKADITAGRYVTGEEMAVIMAARAEGVEVGDEVDVVAEMHARGVPDNVCMAALRAIVTGHRQVP